MVNLFSHNIKHANKMEEVLQIYEEFFEDHPNIDFKIKLIDDNSYIRAIQNKYQFLYDRAYNNFFRQ